MKRIGPSLRKAIFGMQLRTTLLLTTVVLAATILTSLVYGRISDRVIMNEARRNARNIAKAVAAASASEVVLEDQEALLAIAQNVSSQGDLAYIVFTDVSGRILQGHQSGAGQIRRLLKPQEGLISVQPIDQPMLIHDDDAGPRVDVVYPVQRRLSDAVEDRPSMITVGYVRLGLDLTTAQERLASVQFQVRALAVATALLMVPLGFEVVRRVVEPLSVLVSATQRMARGDLTVRVDSTRRDEIGDLNRSFNGMAEELARSYDQLIALNTELEDRVVQRTRALETANRQLHNEIEEKEDFIRTISHDLSAPLRNAKGMAGMLRSKQGDRLDDDALRCLDRIEHNIRHELELIDDLMELSQIQSGDETRTDIDLNAEFQALARKLEFEMNRKKIQLVVHPAMPRLYCDRLRIRQLLQNLIDNAVKYTADAPVEGETASRIQVSCEDRGSEFLFRVADEGIGVTAGDARTIFHVFRRSSNSFVRGVSGRGVGLSCCKSIVQKYGGTIWVEPNAPRGSVFCFTLSKAAVTRDGAAAAAVDPMPAQREAGSAVCVS